jgi:hypothetical protein
VVAASAYTDRGIDMYAPTQRASSTQFAELIRITDRDRPGSALARDLKGKGAGLNDPTLGLQLPIELVPAADGSITTDGGAALRILEVVSRVGEIRTAS